MTMSAPCRKIAQGGCGWALSVADWRANWISNQSALSSLKLGVEQTYSNITIFPLSGAADHSLAYLSLSEAMSAGLLLVIEASVTGTVPELKVINH